MEAVIDKGNVNDDNLPNKVDFLCLSSSSSPSLSPLLSSSPISIKSNQYILSPCSEQKQEEVLRSFSPTLHFQCYIGNLTSWTTDKEIAEAIKIIGVNDVIEIKFIENRNNGISKGFCICTVASNDSLELIYDKITKMEFHKQSPIVKNASNDTLAYFESLYKSEMVYQSQEEVESHLRSPKCGPQNPSYGYTMPLHKFYPTGPHFYQNGGSRHIQPSFNWPRGPFYYPAAPFDQRQIMTRYQTFFSQHHFRRGGQWTQPPPMQPTQGFSRHRAPYHRPYPREPFSPELLPPGISPTTASHVLNRAPSTTTPVAPHVNPKFLPPGIFSKISLSPLSGTCQTSPLSPASKNSVNKRRASSPPTLRIKSEEFECSISNCRTVATAAITRAVRGAANGDSDNAIETLETAVDILRRSKAFRDDRVKLLIETLQDTLCRIESKCDIKTSRKRDHSPDSNSHSDRNHSHHYHRNKYRHESRSSDHSDQSRHRRQGYSYSNTRREYKERVCSNYSDSRHHDRDDWSQYREDEYIPRIQRSQERSRSRERSESRSRSRHSRTATESEKDDEVQSEKSSSEGDDCQER